MKKRLPTPASDAEAEQIVETTDLSQVDLSVLKPKRFEFSRKEARVNMRLPDELLQAVKTAADEAGMPYQRYIRHVLEEAVSAR